MSNVLPRRFTVVAAPTILAAIGEVLRKAFGRPMPLETFEKMVLRLDRN